jgi:hypothetical protein
MIGYYPMDVYAEAAAAPEGYVEVDFLTGRISGGQVSPSFSAAIKIYQEELPKLCERHGVEVTDLHKLTARFSGQGFSRGFSVMTEDNDGRTATDYFRGMPGKRVKVLDHLGRVRPK